MRRKIKLGNFNKCGQSGFNDLTDEVYCKLDSELCDKRCDSHKRNPCDGCYFELTCRSLFNRPECDENGKHHFTFKEGKREARKIKRLVDKIFGK